MMNTVERTARPRPADDPRRCRLCAMPRRFVDVFQTGSRVETHFMGLSPSSKVGTSSLMVG
ncbi:hypothetical protein BCh11DRAFT_06007 [Burkholderia sp. Ch1-1]|nr:hypothetical protein BCh11DRAFT_06007 [Burkholderia sp. Ch1-1]